MDVNLNIDPRIFNDVYYPELQNMARVQIIYGGSSSGKSVFKAQQAVLDVLSGGRNWLVCRQGATDLRTSTFEEIKRVVSDWGLGELFKINEMSMRLVCGNGYQILCKGLDDIEKVKSIVPSVGAWTDVWVEEATQVAKKSITQLMKRQRGRDSKYPKIKKRVHLTFNPILKTHYIYSDYFQATGWADEQTQYKGKDGRLSILKTWYIHNKFLTQEDVDDLLHEKDEYFRAVYTFGNWGVLGNVIFTNWSVADLSGMVDQFTNRRNGGDFGFSNDPAAYALSHYDRMRSTIYIFKELYELGLTNDVLAGLVLPMSEGDEVVWDSAEPKSIEELNQHGLLSTGARKGKDSIIHGIQWLQQQTIIIDKSCINTHNDCQQDKWKENKSGNAMRPPVDKFNHIIDALRYSYEDDMLHMPALL